MHSPITLEQSFDLLTGVDTAGPATRFVQEQREQRLASEMEELAGLRFSIVITAKWEASGEENPQHRDDLRLELDDLRRRYYDKIDQIAMTFGVAEAMHAKEEVERNVTLPLQALADIESDFGLFPDSATSAAPDSATEATDDDLCV
jgi:hypothetical protein